MMLMPRAMKTYRPAQSPGFFDVELRVQWLEAKGNPLSRLDAVMGWEGFRPLLAQTAATLVSLNAPMLPVRSTCGPAQRSRKSPF